MTTFTQAITNMHSFASNLRTAHMRSLGTKSNAEKHSDAELIEKFGNVKGTFEMHHFFDIIGTDDNPIDQQHIDYFDLVCTHINSQLGEYFAPKKMKSPHLALNFNLQEMHDSKGLYDPTKPEHNKYISILQPSLYLVGFNYAECLDIMHHFTDLFCEFGFNVIREKLECCMRGTTGIPTTPKEAYDNAQIYGKYYEFHISIKRNDSENITPDDIIELNQIVSDLEFRSGLRFAFSYNKHHEGQMFINVRMRTVPTDHCIQWMAEISEYIKKTEKFYVNKIIEEYILYDTFPALDAGWIDSNVIDLQGLEVRESIGIMHIN